MEAIYSSNGKFYAIGTFSKGFNIYELKIYNDTTYDIVYYNPVNGVNYYQSGNLYNNGIKLKDLRNSKGFTGGQKLQGFKAYTEYKNYWRTMENGSIKWYTNSEIRYKRLKYLLYSPTSSCNIGNILNHSLLLIAQF